MRFISVTNCPRYTTYDIASRMTNAVKDEECCNVIAASIAEIVRRSLNDDFRHKCFEILETSNTYGLEKNVTSLLKEMRLAKYSRKPQKDTAKAAVSTVNNPATDLAAKETITPTAKENNPEESLVPDDIDLETIDDWD